MPSRFRYFLRRFRTAARRRSPRNERSGGREPSPVIPDEELTAENVLPRRIQPRLSSKRVAEAKSWHVIKNRTDFWRRSNVKSRNKEETMEYRIEHDTMGEVRVPADRYWARRRSAATKILKLERKECPKRSSMPRYPQKSRRAGKILRLARWMKKEPSRFSRQPTRSSAENCKITFRSSFIRRKRNNPI